MEKAADYRYLFETERIYQLDKAVMPGLKWELRQGVAPALPFFQGRYAKFPVTPISRTDNAIINDIILLLWTH